MAHAEIDDEPNGSQMMPIFLFIILIYLPPLLSPAYLFAESTEAVSLMNGRFQASGKGDFTTKGSIDPGSTELRVHSSATWQRGHGIRIRRAGENARIDNADSGWSGLLGHGVGPVEVSHDTTDKVEGLASVRCKVIGTLKEPVDMCRIVLPGAIDMAYDELSLWVKSSADSEAGRLQIHITGDTCPDRTTFELPLPGLVPGEWTEVFLELKRVKKLCGQFENAYRTFTLRCTKDCDGLTVHLDDLWLVKDLVAKIKQITPLTSGGATFKLDKTSGRRVRGEAVYHDDTLAIRAWLEEANRLGGALLFAPPGIYNISAGSAVGLSPIGGIEPSYSLPLYNNTRIKCTNPTEAIFKNSGRSATGPQVMFRSVAKAPAAIVIEQCGFDWNGWNLRDFGSVILITPHTDCEALAQNIQIRGSRFFDSALPGMQGCDFGQAECATRQRHHILVQRVDGIWIEKNVLSGGGRIKLGGGGKECLKDSETPPQVPSGRGRNMYIRNNVVDFVNDNAVTIVDTTIGGITEQVQIVSNRIRNPVGVGIFFGADGESFANVEGMSLQDIAIERNTVEGFFINGIVGVLPDTALGIRIAGNMVIAKRDTDIHDDIHHVIGISVKRGDEAKVASREISVIGNSVRCLGAHAVFNVAAIQLDGPLNNLAILDNKVLWEGCRSIDRGISLRYGIVHIMTLNGNIVDGAGSGVVMGHSRLPVLELSGGEILRNLFVNSKAPNTAQIMVDLTMGGRVEARIADNTIHDGAGYGILCRGTGEFGLTDITMNDFAANAMGDISCVRRTKPE